MFASYAVFGHRRPMNAVIVVGVVLVANMALTVNDQLWFLVLYSLASLFLLIRSHVFDEQSEWLRRRIGDPSSISSVYLRGGTIFIVVAVAGSVLLTQTAASAPLAGAFDGVQDSLIGISRAVSRFLPTGGQTRAARPDLRRQHAGPAGLEHRQGDRADHPPRPDRQGASTTGVRWPTTRSTLKGWSADRPRRPIVRPAGSSVLDKMADDVDPDRDSIRSRSRSSRRLPRADHPLARDTDGGPGEQPAARPSERAATSRRSNAMAGAGRTRSTALTQVAGRRPGRAERGRARGGRHRLPAGDQGPLPPEVATGRSAATPRSSRTRSRPRRSSDTPVRPRPRRCVKVLQDRSQLHSTTTDVRDLDCAATLDRRVLRDLQEGVLPVLRGDDGRAPARHGHPDADRRGVPAGRGGPPHRQRDASSSAAPTPGSRSTSRAIGWVHVRPDRSATCRRSRRCRRARRSRAAPRSSLGLPLASAQGRSRPADRSAQQRLRRGLDGGRPAARAAARRRGPAAVRRRAAGVRRLAARSARPDHGRRRVRHGHPHRVAVRVRAAAGPDGLRVRRLARRGPAGLRDRSWRWSPGPRSSRSTPSRSSARSGSPACAPPSAGCGSSLLRLAFHRKERRTPPLAARSLGGAPARCSLRRSRQLASGLRPSTSSSVVAALREVGGQVVRAQDRAPGAQLDHGDPARVHRPHPEPLERQVEQGQQRRP